MKRKILLLAAALMMFMGVVSASSINGDYKGNPIVKVMSNGKLLQSDEVPAQIYDGHTIVPISLLRQIGASVEWNADTYSVDVKLPQQPAVASSVNYTDDVEMFRFLYYANEEAAVAFQLMPLIDMMNSQSDHQLMLNRINAIRTDAVTGWSNFLSAKQVYGSDINKVNQIEKSLVIVKNYLLKFDTKSALAEWNILKPIINDLYSKYDLNLLNRINGTTAAPSSQVSSAPIVPNSQSQPIITPQNPVQQNPVQQNPSQPTQQQQIKKLSLYSNDGKVYLGKLTSNEFDSDSIYNEFGDYGSEFSSKSIFNQFSDYGSEFSDKSSFNEFATKPPIILSEGKIAGVLTKNSTLTNAISPLGLKEWLKNNGY